MTWGELVPLSASDAPALSCERAPWPGVARGSGRERGVAGVGEPASGRVAPGRQGCKGAGARGRVRTPEMPRS